MAPKTRAKSVKAGAKDPIPKQTIKSKLRDTADAAANVSAAPLDSIELVGPRESAEVPSLAVLPEWNGKRRRSGLPTEDEVEVADFLGVLVAAATMVQMKKDPNQSAPVQKECLVQSTTRPEGAAVLREVRDPNSSLQHNDFIRLALLAAELKFC